MVAVLSPKENSNSATMSQLGNVATAFGLALGALALGWQRFESGIAGSGPGEGRNAISPVAVERALVPLWVFTTTRWDPSPEVLAGTAMDAPDEKVGANRYAGSSMVKSQLVRLAVTTQQPSWVDAMASGFPPIGSMP